MFSQLCTHHREGQGSGADRQTDRRRDGGAPTKLGRIPLGQIWGKRVAALPQARSGGGLWRQWRRRSPLWRSRTRPRPGRRGTSCFTWAVAGRTERRMSKSCYFPRPRSVAPGTDDFTVRAHLSLFSSCAGTQSALMVTREVEPSYFPQCTNVAPMSNP